MNFLFCFQSIVNVLIESINIPGNLKYFFNIFDENKNHESTKVKKKLKVGLKIMQKKIFQPLSSLSSIYLSIFLLIFCGPLVHQHHRNQLE